jgi:glucan 1,3-beta-glucosidase
MATGGPSGQTVGSVTILDSSFTDTDVAILTAHTSSSSPATGGSLILDNVSLTNIRDAIRGPSGTILAGGSKTVAGWGQGHEYGPGGPKVLSGPITPFARPSTLTVNGNYMTFSKPQYNELPASSFVSVRTEGAKGDGITDDTAALSVILFRAAIDGKVVFFDAGTYKVTSTLRIPHGSRIVGESYSVIMGSGPYFSDMENPHPVVAVGFPGFHGLVEWSDMIVSTQGATAGAILIQWNMKSLRGRSPSGMWDVHTRIGGFKGSELQLANCPSTPSETSVVNKACIAAFASMYFANGASSAYLENTWFWVADHDMDDPNLGRITVYGGRGLNIASSDGSFWLVGTAAEHHTLYQYQFAETQDVFAGQIQTETAYYQPNPPAIVPFPAVPVYKDYDFQTGCAGKAGNCAMAWGLRVVDSRSIVVYGAGLYSFFDNYSTCKYYVS